jgi:hypothetical protein
MGVFGISSPGISGDVALSNDSGANTGPGIFGLFGGGGGGGGGAVDSDAIEYVNGSASAVLNAPVAEGGQEFAAFVEGYPGEENGERVVQEEHTTIDERTEGELANAESQAPVFVAPMPGAAPSYFSDLPPG